MLVLDVYVQGMRTAIGYLPLMAAAICAARRVYSDLKQGPHNNDKPSLQDALVTKTIQAMAEGEIYGRRIETNTESTIEALL